VGNPPQVFAQSFGAMFFATLDIGLHIGWPVEMMVRLMVHVSVVYKISGSVVPFGELSRPPAHPQLSRGWRKPRRIR